MCLHVFVKLKIFCILFLKGALQIARVLGPTKPIPSPARVCVIHLRTRTSPMFPDLLFKLPAYLPLPTRGPSLHCGKRCSGALSLSVSFCYQTSKETLSKQLSEPKSCVWALSEHYCRPQPDVAEMACSAPQPPTLHLATLGGKQSTACSPHLTKLYGRSFHPRDI